MKVRSNWLTGRLRSTQILYFEWQNRGWIYKIAGLHEEAIRSFEYAMRLPLGLLRSVLESPLAKAR
jgi:hypothetical protein